MAKYTAGPWVTDGFNVTGKAHNQPICNMVPASLFPGHFIEQEANATLIAAAPELLEALQAIVAAEAESSYGAPEAKLESLYMAIQAAVPVIAKATNND